jgi:acetyl esterase/lipase
VAEVEKTSATFVCGIGGFHLGGCCGYDGKIFPLLQLSQQKDSSIMQATHLVPFRLSILVFVIGLGVTLTSNADEPRASSSNRQAILLWPGMAPGETTTSLGEKLPPRDTDISVVTRVEKIRTPSMDVFAPSKPNGTAIIILPGGGFARVVPDLEGSEAAVWLNRLGITAFVLSYRTSEAIAADEPKYLRPLQDAQRAVRWVRANSEKWNIQQDRVGVLGFSAGGQVASILHTSGSKAAYEPNDAMDSLSFRPDFSLLIYPWNVLAAKSDNLMPELQFSKELPPAFIVHTSDDKSSAVGAALIYAGLRKHEVPAELHIYETGGHGYGTRSRPNSMIGTWTDRASEWLVLRGLGSK